MNLLILTFIMLKEYRNYCEEVQVFSTFDSKIIGEVLEYLVTYLKVKNIVIKKHCIQLLKLSIAFLIELKLT